MSDLREKIRRFVEAVENHTPPLTEKVIRICKYGSYADDVTPDRYDNLPAERAAACAVLADIWCPHDAKAPLVRYIEAVDELMRRAE